MTIDEFNELKPGDIVVAPGNFRGGIVKLTAEVMEKATYVTREVPNKPDLTVRKHMVHIRVITPRKQFRNRTAWFDISHLEKGRKTDGMSVR